jgi:YhcH/YjgK/YiaL family protein
MLRTLRKRIQNMIVTDVKHITCHGDVTLAFTKAIEFLRLRGIHDLPDGKVEIEGDNVFAIIQRYETQEADTPKFEYHRKYIDVQYLASGEEIIGWAPVERMTITDPYDAEKDVAFGTMATGKWTPVYLQAGQAAVFWPDDGHAPKLAAGAPSAVMKIVVKVAV